MAIDVSLLTDDIALTIAAVGAVGSACLLMWLVVGAFKNIREALGYSGGRIQSPPAMSELDRQNAATAAWDSGYMRRQFDASWSAEEKAAWREGVAAQHADKR